MRPVRAKALIINAFALAGRFAIFNPYTQGAALGYVLLGLSARFVDFWHTLVCPYKAIISFKCRINPFCGSSGWFRDAFGWNRPHLRVHQGLGIVKERWAIVYNLMLARQKELCNRCFSLSWHRSTEVVFIFVTLVQRDNLLIISSLERIWWRWAFQFQLFQFILKGCDISLFLYNILIIN